ncbi:hypothetical protein [Paenibacillus sp. PvR053]
MKIVISATLLWTSTILIASADGKAPGVQPGSVDDPIITKSYFDQNIDQKIADAITGQSVNEEKLKQLIAAEVAKSGTPSTPGVGNNNGQTDAGSGLTVIKLEQGQSLYGGAGTEFIVRTGKVVAFSSTADGIADVTAAKDITAGTSVELNHLLIVPREGRGIKPDPKFKQEIYVMVRGSYLLTNADGTKVTP